MVYVKGTWMVARKAPYLESVMDSCLDLNLGCHLADCWGLPWKAPYLEAVMDSCLDLNLA